MKRKTICLCVAMLTFILGATFASLLVVTHQPSNVEVPQPNYIESVSTVGSVNSSCQRKISTAKSKNLAAIEITRFDPEFETIETKIEGLSIKPINLDLEFSLSIENQIIALHPYPNDSREFKIEQQFETSMSISEEGPHIDLTDWKHYTSDWREIKELSGNRFLTLNISAADHQKFPKVMSKEIYNAVLKNGGKRWADYARSCKNANDSVCSVSISRISFRIKAKENGKWNVIHKINVSIPVGC